MKALIWLALTLLLLPAVSALGDGFVFRGLWVTPGEFSTAKAADKLLDQCRRAKINALLPNVMVHGSVMHKSSHYLHGVVANDKFDPLAYLVQKAHAAGIQVHPWYNVYYEGAKGLPPAKPEWLCTDIDGKRMDEAYFLSPQVPGVNEYLLSVIQDGLAYDVDGIHLDYIRYYGTSYDYSALGREEFAKTHGFDPIDFLDHTERIVPTEKEPFPIRLLHADAHLSRPWMVTWAESLMDRAGVGWGYVTEKPEKIDALRAPGLLVLSTYYDVTPEMTAAIKRYVERGGSLLWIDSPALGRSPELARLLGVKPAHTDLPTAWRRVEAVGSHPLTGSVSSAVFHAGAVAPRGVDGGTAIARFESGEPAIVVNHPGGGQTALVAFNAGAPTTDEPSRMVRGVIDWLRRESGVKPAPDLLAARRSEWIRFRISGITRLVQSVHQAVKAKNPKLAVSIAGGFNPSEPRLIFRDSKRWLDENLLDFSISMDYVNSVSDLEHQLDGHRPVISSDKMKTFYPGLSLYAAAKVVGGKKVPASQDPKILRDELRLLRQKGYRGFALFSSLQMTEEQIKVIARAGE